MNGEQLVRFTKGLMVAAVALLIIGVFLKVSLGGRTHFDKKMMSWDERTSVTAPGMAANMASPEMAMPAEEMGMDSAASSGMAYGAPDMMPVPPMAGGALPGEEQKMVKTGNLDMRVDDADAAAAALAEKARAFGGTVSSSNLSEDVRGVKSGSVSIRVPSDRFDEAFAALKGIGGTVLSESANADDVTRQYVDLEARLKNKQAEEETFVALLDRSGKLDDVIQITREVARVRGEIEQLQASLNYLSSQTALATITVSLSEDPRIGQTDREWKPLSIVKSAFNALFRELQAFIGVVIWLIIVLVPVLLLYILIGWLLFRLGRRLVRRWIR